MFKSKLINANDNLSDAESDRFIAELKPYIYASVICLMLGAGAAAVLIWSLFGIIRILFFS